MTNALPLKVVCEDFLQDNHRLYAHKAKRKKIALIAIEAASSSASGTLTLDLGAAELISDKKRHGVEPPEAPRGWWAFTPGTEEAGWPEGHRKKFKPEMSCPICKESVNEQVDLTLYDGPFGVEFYHVHSECLERAG